MQWTEPIAGILVWRYPIGAIQIRSGALLKVRESQTAALLHRGAIVEIFGPGLHTVSSGYSPEDTNIYFFSMRPQMGLRWETATPVALGRKWNVVRMRGFGSYAYQIADPHKFYSKVCGPVNAYYGSDLAFHIRDSIAARMAEIIAGAQIALADLASNREALAQMMADGLRPWLEELGVKLYQFGVDSLSFLGELDESTRSEPAVTPPTEAETKYCVQCGQAIPKEAKSCWECGKRQPEISDAPASPTLP